jgi:hypothetical protein
MNEELNIDQNVEKRKKVKKILKNIGWFNFIAYFFYGYGVAMAVYTRLYHFGLMFCLFGFSANLMSWKGLRTIKKIEAELVNQVL